MREQKREVEQLSANIGLIIIHVKFSHYRDKQIFSLKTIGRVLKVFNKNEEGVRKGCTEGARGREWRNGKG